MSRYIDADEFLRCLQNYRPYVDSGRFNAIQTEVNQVLDCIEYEIEDASSIDIVRCKECKHCKRRRGTFRGEPMFFYRCAEHSRDVESDDFCSWAERSE